MRAIALVSALVAVTAVAASVTLQDVHPAIASGQWRRHDGLTAATDKASQLHRVWLSIAQRNLDVLERTFWAVSDPKSPLYGQYLSQSEVTALVAPAPQVLQSITEWVQGGAEGRSDVTIDCVANRDACHITAPVAHFEQLFGVQMHAYVPNADLLKPKGTVLFRSATTPVLPAHVREHIVHVKGISEFPPVTKRQAARMRAHTAAQQFRAKLKSGANAPGVPLIQRARGREGLIQLWWTPVCLNGQTSAVVPPCSDQGGVAIQSVVTYGQTTINPNGPVTYQQMDAADSSVCDVESGVTQCHTSFAAPWYDAYTANIDVSFANGQGFIATNANVVANIPPVTPQKLWALYGLGGAPRTSTNVTQCVVEFEQQYYAQSDLELFFAEMGVVNTAPVTVIGPNDQSNPGGEAALDIEWIMAMAPGAPTTFWSIYANSSVEVDDILTWSYAIGNATVQPQVNSLSYGMSEGNVDYYLGKGYVARSDVEFQKLALQGLTIIIADGDTGAGDLGGPPMGFSDCQTKLHPDWPSQSPYVTAVGSTFITPNAQPVCYLPASEGGIDCSQGPDGEVGVALNYGIHWTTGGGFSDVTKQAPYQADVVNAYLALGNAVLPPESMFNATGRAYPDVVTCGHNLETALSGTFQSIDGTSASAPIFAGLVTMWNDARVAAGKSVLGFINPLLYSLKTSSYRDVVIADNHCGGEGDTCCSAAYKGAVGWDAVTGLGSPLWAEVTKQILALP